MGQYNDRSWFEDLAVSLIRKARRDLGLVTLGELADAWLDDIRSRCSSSYVVQCETIVNLLLDVTPPRALAQQVRPEHLSALLEAAADRGCTVHTLGTYRKLLTIFWGWVQKQGYRPTNLAHGLQLPRRARPPKVDQHLPTEFVEAFLAACDDWFRPVAATAILAGLRRSECTGLEWVDVLPDRLRVESAKKRETTWRDVPLHPRLADELGSAPKVEGSRWVFPVLSRRNGKEPGEQRRPNTRHFLDQVRRAADRIGMPPRSVSFQGLRSTFAILVQESCGDDWLVAQLLGHTSGRRDTVIARTYYLFAEWRRKVEAIDGIRLEGLRGLVKR